MRGRSLNGRPRRRSGLVIDLELGLDFRCQ